MQIVLVALSQFAGDHGLGLAHVLDGTLDGDDAFQVKAVYVINAADGDFRVGLLHNPLDGVATLANDSSNQIVVSENLECDFPV